MYCTTYPILQPLQFADCIVSDCESIWNWLIAQLRLYHTLTFLLQVAFINTSQQEHFISGSVQSVSCLCCVRPIGLNFVLVWIWKNIFNWISQHDSELEGIVWSFRQFSNLISCQELVTKYSQCHCMLQPGGGYLNRISSFPVTLQVVVQSTALDVAGKGFFLTTFRQLRPQFLPASSLFAKLT